MVPRSFFFSTRTAISTFSLKVWGARENVSDEICLYKKITYAIFFIWKTNDQVYICMYCMYVYVYIHTYIHTYIHAYIHIYMHTYIYTCIRTCTQTYIHTFVHIYIYIYIHSYCSATLSWWRGSTGAQLLRVEFFKVILCIKTVSYKNNSSLHASN